MRAIDWQAGPRERICQQTAIVLSLSALTIELAVLLP